MSTSLPSAREKPIRQQALREELRQLADVVGPAPLVDLLLERAFQLGATDIHFDPHEEGLRVRLRMDGLLHDVLHLPADLTAQVVSRIKLMAAMDITEKRLSQDGHFSNSLLGQERDIRVGSGPTIHGERLVLRLMPDQASFTRLEELGLDEGQVETIKRIIAGPYGMVLCVGPVGSGKSTTIYSGLRFLSDPTQSLVTIEDPVERRIEGVNQMQVDQKIRFGFVEALRGVLRQDPDVMMIGEIRDPETAHIACRAALTGITVLSTLHASDAVSTVDVFREFSVPPMFIADSLKGLISQRLVRKVCEHCRTTYHPDAAACQMLGIDAAEAERVGLVKGAGCDVCFQTGYHGRTGIFEVLPVTPDLRKGILQEKPHDDLLEIARRDGMQTLDAMARRAVLDGVTTVQEMHRVLV
jgi:type II secretory ATPase GspE/PulE/Tfp pilus assembly ATPase PilB-like protein